MYFIYRQSVVKKEHDISVLNAIKKFSKDDSIEIDQWTNSGVTRDVTNINAIGRRMNITSNDMEYMVELNRRAKFDFYHRLILIQINKTMESLLFSFSRDKFISHNTNERDWQLFLFGPSRPYILKGLNINPKDHMPELANGYLGISGFSDEVQMQSLFSGSYMETHRASIPSWSIRNITGVFDLKGNNLISGRRLELDMSNGRLIQIMSSDDCIVEQQIYAHQTLKSLIVHEILVQFLDTTLDVIVLKLPKDRKRDVGSNIDITVESENMKYIKIVSGITHVNDQHHHEQHIHAYYHSIPLDITVKRSRYITKYYYLMSVNELKEVARHHFDQGMKMMEDNNQLFMKHDAIWQNIWSSSGVFMTRLNQVDVALISAQYLINSNLPSIGQIDKYGAMGSTGLGVASNQGAGHSLMTNCGGRIEYSQELWLINSQMLLHPQSVKSIINKRISQLPEAKTNAANFFFRGAKYPFATNEEGEELCLHTTYCQNIHFPSGLVAMALSRYLWATADETMFANSTGMGALLEINEFWRSFLDKYKSNDKESVPLSNIYLNVINSVFEAGLIRENLLIIPSMVNFFKITPTSEFAEYLLNLHNLSKTISLPFDNMNNYHPPYTGFNLKSDTVYIPEGVMLRYPLDQLVDIDLSVRNLKVYEKRLVMPINPMSLSILFINNMEADRYSEAEDNFKNLLKYCDNNFKVWSNNTNHWKGSYIPAAAGYLDSVMFGLLGIRIRGTGLYMYPKLIMDISLIELSNIEYLGSTIKVIVDAQKGISLQIMSARPKAWRLGVQDLVKNRAIPLVGVVPFPLNSHIVIKKLKLTMD